ncbi:hypothetical protein E8E12_011010 [Didymella heteroderae]|uniref:Uncharacterized protein n=1 Tax=Didymella heteroderae TaxID=1769908 RepID=A0A9P4X021_9PLEO|nr:hypothetical protein E8E12_011010 [Didymella heteroderae]
MATLSPDTITDIKTAKTISGPHSLYNDSFTLEFLEPPPALDATVLMRSTYLAPSNKLGKSHPQAPPLHLHFLQAETFFVTKGIIGTTLGYSTQDQSWKAGSHHEIAPWTPHCFWPHPDAREDSTVYVWAHPDAGDEAMDCLFFENLLRYMSDVCEGKAKLDLVQVLAMQHASASAPVVFPTAWWLGPLRWWVPWTVQKGIAGVGRLCGYKALMQKYTGEEEWEEYLRTKRA